MRWRESTLIEVALVAVAIALSLEGVRSGLPVGLSNWRTANAGTGGRLTPAGWWYAVVSLPVFQFLLWRWFWRKWLRGGAPPDELVLGTADLQSLADLGNSFEVVRNMRAVPVTFRQRSSCSPSPPWSR